MGVLDRFDEVWCGDFEYRCPDGYVPEVRCGVFQELRSGREIALWDDELRRHTHAPFRTDRGACFVAHNAVAEYGCFLRLGWPMPACTFDTFVEFRATTNGMWPTKGAGLLGALQWFGLPCIDAVEKEEMRQLAMREGPSDAYTAAERKALIDYCRTDVVALIRILPAMEPLIRNLDHSLIRGHYATSGAHMESNGIPMDVRLLNKLQEAWPGLKPQLVKLAEGTGVFDSGGSFSTQRFIEFLNRHRIGWPLLPSGELQLEDETFRQMEKAYPREIGPIRAVRRALSNTRLFEGLAIGPDGRNRCGLRAFATKTSRHAPSSAKFLMGGASWLRGLVCGEPGTVVLSKDFDQEEFLIGGALSGDANMIAAYRSGDPYLAFAKMAGAVPADATKASHPAERAMFKTCVLGVQYGMSYFGLADRIGKPTPYARELLRQHKDVFRDYWAWVQAAVTLAMADLRIETVLGWPLHIVAPADPNERINHRSIGNFPCQANGGEILRLSINRLVAAGIKVLAPVHDAVLIQCDERDVEEVNRIATFEMEEATRILLHGHTITTDTTVITDGNRYVDERGAKFWNHLMGLIGETQLCVAEE